MRDFILGFVQIRTHDNLRFVKGHGYYLYESNSLRNKAEIDKLFAIVLPEIEQKLKELGIL